LARSLPAPGSLKSWHQGDERGRGHAEPDDVAPRVGRGRPGPRELFLGRLLERPGKAEAAVPYRVVHGGQAGVEPAAEKLLARRARGIVVGAERAYLRAQFRFLRRWVGQHTVAQRRAACSRSVFARWLDAVPVR
jgi:hypothetical protein